MTLLKEVSSVIRGYLRSDDKYRACIQACDVADKARKAEYERLTAAVTKLYAEESLVRDEVGDTYVRFETEILRLGAGIGTPEKVARIKVIE